jgi:hypothetical protein
VRHFAYRFNIFTWSVPDVSNLVYQKKLWKKYMAKEAAKRRENDNVNDNDVNRARLGAMGANVEIENRTGI